MKSLLNAFTKKEGKEKAVGSVGRLVSSHGLLLGGEGTRVPPQIAGYGSSVHRSRNNCPSFVVWFGSSQVWKINTDEGAFVF